MESYLNTENIARSTGDVEYHPLRPFLPENACVLFLGSFPPQRKRWSMDFFYPNFINDHWRIEGQVFFGDKNHFVDLEAKRFRLDEIVVFSKERGLAFFDTSTAVRRIKDNASDKFLEVVKPTDIRVLLRQLPHRRTIVTTGEKAIDTICDRMHIPIIPKVKSRSDPAGIQTLDLQNRNLTLYSAKLRDRCIIAGAKVQKKVIREK